MKIEDIGEEEVVNRLLKRISHGHGNGIIVPAGDDAAVVKFSQGKYCVTTTDMLIEDVHFKLQTTTPFDLGYKSLAVNLSDLAAMAAVPRFAQIGLGLPGDMDVNFFDEFYEGFLACSNEFDTVITGGDISSADKFIISVTVMGETDLMSIARRSDAHMGDVICVTGFLGSSAAGLELLEKPGQYPALSKKANTYLVEAHAKPTPRVKEALEISKIGVNAMEDISDGLAADLRHICDSSNVGALIYEKDIPTALALFQFCKISDKSCLDYSLNGGEDYELLFTTAESSVKNIKKEIMDKFGVPVSAIGEVLPREKGIKIITKNGNEEPVTGGFDHFKK